MFSAGTPGDHRLPGACCTWSWHGHGQWSLGGHVVGQRGLRGTCCVPPAAVMEAAPPPTRGLSTSPQASPLRLGGAGSPQDRFTPAVCTPDREVQAQTPPPPPPGWHLQEKGVGPAVDPRWNPNTTPRWCWACPCPLPSDLRPLGPTPFPLLPASCPLFCAPTSCCPRPGNSLLLAARMQCC